MNTHSSDVCAGIKLPITDSDVCDVRISVECVYDAFSHLKQRKIDSSGLDSSHLILALPVIAEFLSSFFTLILRHGHLPPPLRDCTLVPVPKAGKDITLVESYRPIALASTLSKALEWCILLVYERYLSTSDLQFGFKPGFSTSMCTGMVKNVVSRYLHHGSAVFWMPQRPLI